LFQTKGLLIHKLYSSIEKILKQIGINFSIEKQCANILRPNFIIKENIKHLNDVYYSPEFDKIVKDLSEQEINVIRKNCLKFYVHSVEEMRKRFLEHGDFLKLLIFVEPTIALNPETRNSFTDLSNVQIYFPFINIYSLAAEWRALPYVFDDKERENLMKLEVESFWHFILQIRNESKTVLRFPTLKSLILTVFSLPHSNAEPERTFSDVNEIKNEKGNKTKISLLNARCFLRSIGNAFGINALNFNPTEKHFQFFSSSNLYGKSTNYKEI